MILNRNSKGSMLVQRKKLVLNERYFFLVSEKHKQLGSRTSES